MFTLSFFFQAEDGIRDLTVTGVQTCALPILGLFLGVDESYPVAIADLNPTRGVRSVRVGHLTHILKHGRGPVSGAINAAVKRVMSKDARKAFLWPLQRRLFYSPPKPADDEFMLELRKRFKPEVEALSDYLGRDLVAQWGYDSLG